MRISIKVASFVMIALVLLCGVSEARNRNELISLFRLSLGENSAILNLVSDSTIGIWANEGQDYVASMAGPILRDTAVEWTIDTGNGFRRLTMPDNFISMNFVMVVDLDGNIKGSLSRGQPDSIGLKSRGHGQYITSGQEVIIDGYQMIFMDSLVFYYFSDPIDMTTGSSDCEIRDIWEPLIIDWMLHRFAQSQRNPSASVQFRATVKQDLVDSRNTRGVARTTE